MEKTAIGKDCASKPAAGKQPSQKLKDLAQRLYCPDPRVNRVETNAEASLSHVPWIIQLEENSAADKTTTETATAPDASESNQAESQPVHATSFLHVSYLELRRQQNIAFADHKAAEATQASLLEHAKAETIFKQALNLVPDHVPSLLGYGKLLIKMGRLQQAQRFLEDVLEVEPNHRIALQYKKVIEQTFKQQQQQQRLGNASAEGGGSLLSTGKKRKDLQMRESSAFQDALLERNLAMEGTAENDGQGSTKRGMNDDSDSYDSEDDDRRRRKRRRHKKDRKRKKKKEKKRRKKDRRRRYDSSSSTSSRSASAS